MDHLHFETDAGPRDTFEVNVDRPANVLMMDQANYERYCLGKDHTCYGGYTEKKGVVRLKAYQKGRWHIVVDMGRSGGLVSATVKNVATGQPVGKLQARELKGAPSGTLEYRGDKRL